MKISVVTPVYNGERYLESCIQSVLAQRTAGVEVEHILVDGGSRDRSGEIADRYRDQIAIQIREKDTGPANAINKGLHRATGDVLAWLNADDLYHPGALGRVARVVAENPGRALCFGHCPIINESGEEIRKGITRFKECFFPLSSRFTFQCINYVSQPAMFFRRTAFEKAGPLREDWVCAWDYEFMTRLWRQGGAVWVRGEPLASFRWHAGSLSGRHFRAQFREEWQAACRDAGWWAPQTWIHLGVWWGIVACYTAMAARRQRLESIS
jgi:glycosyltransferase involved in cell wall biosynthesis